MSSLNGINLQIGPSCWTRSWICHLGRSKAYFNQFFSLGGGGGFWILTSLGRVPKKRPKNVSREKSICKSSLISWVSVSNESFPFASIDGTERFSDLLKSTGVLISKLLLQNARSTSILLSGQSVNPAKHKDNS